VKRKRDRREALNFARESVIKIAREAIDFLYEHYRSLDMGKQYPDFKRFPLREGWENGGKHLLKVTDVLLDAICSRMAHAARTLEDAAILFEQGRHETCVILVRSIQDDCANVILLVYLKGDEFLQHLLEYAIRETYYYWEHRKELLRAWNKHVPSTPAAAQQLIEELKTVYRNKLGKEYSGNTRDHKYYGSGQIHKEAAQLLKDGPQEIPLKPLFNLGSEQPHYGRIEAVTTISWEPEPGQIQIKLRRDQDIKTFPNFPYAVSLFVLMLYHLDRFFEAYHKDKIEDLYQRTLNAFRRWHAAL
jgi:hypothetical protein